uniref:CHK kinase-like domain-containing protein n=1 Tax=Timema genevievae TaxID=629358 RepID=A0A7R9PNA8_TIMGE|nr:unnamed protein product [Timema genevievae]
MPEADYIENKPPETETEELLTKWDLEQLLSAKLGPDTRVDSIATKQLTQPGENYGSNILSVEVTLLPDYKKLDLVAKLVPLSPFLREIFNCGVTVRTEIDVYTKVSKEFQEIQRENNISKKDYLDLFPRCYGARVSRNEDVGQLADEGAVILLENLTPLGYRCGDRITGVDLEHSEMVASRIAKFHATSIAIKIKKPLTFRNVIMKVCEDKTKPSEDMEIGMNKMKKALIKQLEVFPECVKHMNRILEGFEKDMAQFRDGNRAKEKPKEPFATMCHDDFWTNNMMFKYDKSGETTSPVDYKLIDFQMPAYGSPMKDFIYFLFTSTEEGVVVDHYDHLIQIYHKNFTSWLEKLGVNTEPFSFEKLQEEIETVAPKLFVHLITMITNVITRGRDKPPDMANWGKDSFNEMFVLMNTSGVSTTLRPYLPLFLESLLELPILRGDTLVPYEQVVAQLETDTIAVSASIGLENSSRFHCGAFSHTAVLMLQLEPAKYSLCNCLQLEPAKYSLCNCLQLEPAKYSLCNCLSSWSQPSTVCVIVCPAGASQLEPAKYSRCVTWIRELLYQTQFTVERLRILAAKIANDVAQVKRKGNKVVTDLMKGLVYNQGSLDGSLERHSREIGVLMTHGRYRGRGEELGGLNGSWVLERQGRGIGGLNGSWTLERQGRGIGGSEWFMGAREAEERTVTTTHSNHYSSSMLRQHKFLTSLLERLESPALSQKVLQELEEVRAVLTQPANIVVHLAADVDKLPGDPADPWAQMLPSGVNPKRIKLAVTPDWALLTPPCEQKNGSCVVGLGCIESSFLCQTTGCLRDFSDPDLAPLLVFLQYLTQLEGPMWRQIRGQGLSYGYSIVPRPNEGLLYLALYRSTNCVGAYKEARNILECQLSPGAQWEVSLFESARSSLIFEVIEREKNVGDMVTQSLLSYFKAVEHDYNRRLVQLIAGVTVEDLKRVGPQYVARLFDPIHSQTTVVCHPSKVDEIAAGFKELGRELSVYPSLEDSLLSHW